MKFQTLACAIFSALLLSACGGSSNNSTSSANPPSSGNTENNENTGNTENTGEIEENTEADNIITFASYIDGLDDGSKYVKETFTIAGNTLYSDHTQNTLLAPLLKAHFLTKGHHYDISNKKTKYGYELGQIQRLNNQWIQKPYSSKNHNQLTITDTVKTVNLEGKLLAEYIDNEHYQYKRSDYMALFKDNKFEKGAECWLVEDSHASEEYVQTSFYHLTAYKSVQDYFGNRKTQEKTFAGFTVHLNGDPLIEDDEGALIESDDKFFDAIYHKAGKNFDWYEANPEEKVGCTFFNEKAQKTIDALIKD